MYLEPWQIFLAGILVGIFISIVFLVIFVATHIRPAKIDCEHIREEEEENGGEN